METWALVETSKQQKKRFASLILRFFSLFSGNESARSAHRENTMSRQESCKKTKEKRES
jgi:hypothetical protein